MSEDLNTTKRTNNTLIWVIVAAIAVLLCCLCVVCLVAGAAYFWQMTWNSDVGFEPLPFTIVTDTPDTNGDEGQQPPSI